MGIGLRRKKKQAREDAGGKLGGVDPGSNSSMKSSPTGTCRSVSSSSSSSPWPPTSTTSPKTDAALSSLVRGIASTSKYHPLSQAATALVEAETEILAAKFLKDQLGEMLGQSDLVTRGVLNRAAGVSALSAPGGASSTMAGLQEELRAIGLRLKKLAELCNKKPLIMPFAKKKKIFREVASVKTMIIAFARTNDVATSQSSFAEDKLCRLADGVKVPAAAPFIQDWFIQREAVVTATCHRLGVGEGRGTPDNDGRASAGEPPVVGLAGPAGAGKSIAASMVIARDDVRAHFSSNGMVWLPVGQGAKERLPEVMHRLAVLVHELVASKSSADDGRDCRPPRTPDIGVDPEDGAAYVREVMAGDGDEDSSSRGGGMGMGMGALLVVADDVWEADVLEELRRTGASILYTTRSGDLLAGDDGVLPLRVDDVTEGEAEALLRRAAELDDEATLPDSAREIIRQGGLAAMDLACVGRWDSLRKTNDEAAWATALSRVADARRFMDGAALLPWRSAVLLAGLEQLTLADGRNKELYLSLAVLPSDLSLSVDDLTVLLTGGGEEGSPGQDDLEAARRIVETLEKWSVLVREVGGRYRVRGSHTDVAWQAVSDCPEILDRALTRWRKRVSSADAVFAWRVEELVDIWLTMSSLESDQDEEEIPGPYRAVVDAIDPSDPRARELLRRIALFQWSMQDCDAACETWTKLLALDDEGTRASRDQDVDVAFPHVGVTMYTLGAHALGSGRAGEAERWFRKALSFEEKTLGADDLSLADTLHQIASCVSRGGRAEEAELLHLRALGIREESQGHEHPGVAKTLHALGLCVLKAGKVDEAEDYLRRALRIYSEKLAATDPKMATAPYDLGRCLAVAGKTREAEEYFHRALPMQERTRGVSSVPVADTLYALGGCMADAGQMASAEAFYRRALAIREARLGATDPATARAARALAEVLLDAGNAGEAEVLFLQGLAYVERALGDGHPAAADTLHSLGECALARERPGEAAARFRRALAVREEALGDEHASVADTLYELGRCDSQLGRSSDAEESYRRALRIQVANLGEGHEEVAVVLYSLAMCVAGQGGRREEVEELLGRALKIEDDARDSRGAAALDGGDDGDDDGDPGTAVLVADTLHGLAQCALEAGRFDESEKHHVRAIEAYESVLTEDHPKVACALYTFGRLLMAIDPDGSRLEESEALLRRVLAIVGEEGKEEGEGVEHRRLEGRGSDDNNDHGGTGNGIDNGVTASSESRRPPGPQPTARQTLESLAECAAAGGRMHEAKGLWKRAVALREIGPGGSNRSESGGEDEAELPFWLAPVAEAATSAAAAGEEEACGGHGPHAPTVERFDLLGKRAMDEGRTDDALELLQRALEIREKEAGGEEDEEHPELAKTLFFLGRCELDQGRLDEAERLENRALRIQENVLGAEHPDVAATKAVKEEIKRKREFFFG